MAIQSNQPAGNRATPRSRLRDAPSLATALAPLTHLPTAAPSFVDPMKAKLHAGLPRDDGWLFEVKLDGIRALGIMDDGRVELWSRRPRDRTADYPQIVEALRKLPVESAVVDGEVAALDAQGRTSFQSLQTLKQNAANPPAIFFYVFDLLQLNGRDLKGLPLEKRKALLKALLGKGSAPLRFCGALDGPPAKIWEQITRLGLEGIVAKRRASKYEPGRRSGAWLKIKTHQEQEFVIGGYTAAEGSRKYFGSLVVGYYQGSKLMFASRVGTGFDFPLLRSLHGLFQKLRTPQCSFANLPMKRLGRTARFTAAEMRSCVWLKPELVCQVKFMEWTRDALLRQPVFMGLREDKEARAVVREEAA